MCEYIPLQEKIIHQFAIHISRSCKLLSIYILSQYAFNKYVIWNTYNFVEEFIKYNNIKQFFIFISFFIT